MLFSQEVKRELLKNEYKNDCCKKIAQSEILLSNKIEKECCKKAFLSTAFLCFGTASDPEKDYRIEFVTDDKNLSLFIMHMVNSSLYEVAKLQERGKNFVVYIKGAVPVEDALTFMGAFNASMKIMQVKMFKELVNNINRQSNFQTANMDKVFSASAKQTVAIAIISDNMGLENLDDRLKELCYARLHDPHASLRKLSETLNISRSGVNHRMKEILELSDKIEKEKGIKGV